EVVGQSNRLHRDAPLDLSAVCGRDALERIDGIIQNQIRRIAIHAAVAIEATLSICVRGVTSARVRIQRGVEDLEEHDVNLSLLLRGSVLIELRRRKNHTVGRDVSRKVASDVNHFALEENVEGGNVESVLSARRELEFSQLDASRAGDVLKQRCPLEVAQILTQVEIGVRKLEVMQPYNSNQRFSARIEGARDVRRVLPWISGWNGHFSLP